MTNIQHNIPFTQDNRAYRFPVSVKGVVLQESKVVLLKNERDEWELPGGKLELGEEPEICFVREIKEELGLNVKVGHLLDTWVYQISEGVVVLIITYGCYPEPFSEVTHSPEHKDVGLFTLEEINFLKMPNGYKKSIQKWFELSAHQKALQ
ncbi:NUDIX domain-containing protein [Nostoc sp. FACHB-190]|uniref:NUDIX hydrolase n=1 Tax=Nostoc sp. FACHB-190 TaxID=2692838 RepID=UPI0016878E5F|nr:NUDIX hydrolase [Nostoc sp. FACHB-190]MBD2300997.1 NUDIX hydrolase [Nostoc sp. FACHB-190]